jgi:translocation and assembly module TamB
MKVLVALLKATLSLLLMLLVLSAALWVWAGSSTSLATALALAQPYLPAGQSLVFKDVTGSLREGGRVGWLRWQQGALSVEAREAQVRWELRPLLDGELRLSQLKLAHLRIEDLRPQKAAQPPLDLRLPLKVDAVFSLGKFEWAGSTPLQITQASGYYKFDSWYHTVDKLQGHIASGSYTLSGSLQAQAPMALKLRAEGSVQTTLPKTGQAVQVKASAQVSGPLAGRNAVLELKAQLTPELRSSQATQAQVTARLQPWHPQPILDAQAQWQALDLSALWPQAPQTQLSGTASVTPQAQASGGAPSQNWRAELKLSNTQSGPWNQHRLPLERLDAQGVYSHGQWTVDALKAQGADGRLEVQGQFTDPERWAGTLRLHNLNLAALDARLSATQLTGQLKLQQATDQIDLDGQLQTHDAQVQGQVRYGINAQSAQGQLVFTLPGASAQVKGQLAPTQGGGDLSVKVLDAARLNRWLHAWPGIAQPLGQTLIEGQAELNGHWQGGWQGPLPALQLQAQLSIPQLSVRGPSQTMASAWHLRQAQADLKGSLVALSLNLKAQLESGTHRLALQAQAEGGQKSPGVWQAQFKEAQVSMEDSQRTGTWTLQSKAPIDLSLNHNGPTQLTLGAGSAVLFGPAPGSASLTWAPAQWSPTAWHSEGRLQNLPLAWLEMIGQTQMTNLGLRGDLMFGGAWNATGGDTLRLRATLERTSGDLQLLTDDATMGTLRAGVREARLSVTLDDTALATQLSWASERAGQAQAQFSTRLNAQNQAWSWPADAPLSGTLNVKLPPVGVWSLLAPPGWRLRGTLDAQATVSGTRSEPQWRGTLSAQDLAVRSVVDGIDFSQGQLRASLDGQRLNIDDFTLQGAGGNTGGRLSLKGYVLWLPASAPGQALASRLRMSLDATAQALRVSTRADRRLSVSGQLAAQLVDAQLVVTGSLKADQALFILPEDSAPQLDDDVVVRRSAAATPRPVPKTGAPLGVRITPEVNITLDLGPDFAVRGHGLISRLSGQLKLRSGGRDAATPTLTGDLRTERGTFKAYGQQLDLEEGQLRFTGPINNPALNILAIRPNLQQRVGVQISGTALSPSVRLYSDPELPDAEKLAWLVLGRSAANGGAESAVLQQAALALLGGKGKSLSGGMADALGLDELSMRGASSNADGSSTSAAITLGKRLSRDIYVAYERSLAGTLGTFYIFYDLSRRFTLRAQTGEQSAVDLIFTLRYD